MPDAINQGQPPRPAPSKSSRRSIAEDRAWARLYADVSQASVAEEVVKQFDADPESKRHHLALYLRAKTAVRKRKAIDARNQRIGIFVRAVATFLVVGLARGLRSILSGAVDLAVAMLPPTRKEPAKAVVPGLKKDPQFADASQRYTEGAGAAQRAEREGSRGAKAA
jgi:hypothetical protein